MWLERQTDGEADREQSRSAGKTGKQAGRQAADIPDHERVPRLRGRYLEWL